MYHAPCTSNTNKPAASSPAASNSVPARSVPAHFPIMIGGWSAVEIPTERRRPTQPRNMAETASNVTTDLPAARSVAFVLPRRGCAVPLDPGSDHQRRAFPPHRLALVRVSEVDREVGDPPTASVAARGCCGACFALPVAPSAR